MSTFQTMIHSMTGFAARTLDCAGSQISLELRSVNQRHLELHFRLSDEIRALEPQLRERLQAKLARGKVECRIQIQGTANDALDNGPSPAALESIARWQDCVRARFPEAAPLDVNAILRWVSGLAPAPEADTGQRDAAVLDAFGALIDELVACRRREGDKLAAHLAARLDALDSELAALRAILPGLMQQQRARMAERLAEALADPGHERIAQEVALVAQKLDVDEELARIDTHLAEVRRVLARGGAVGKRLDFLMQELHREANTLGSKSAASETTRTALELKVLIEQMREQIQNIE